MFDFWYCSQIQMIVFKKFGLDKTQMKNKSYLLEFDAKIQILQSMIDDEYSTLKNFQRDII